MSSFISILPKYRNWSCFQVQQNIAISWEVAISVGYYRLQLLSVSFKFRNLVILHVSTKVLQKFFAFSVWSFDTSQRLNYEHSPSIEATYNLKGLEQTAVLKTKVIECSHTEGLGAYVLKDMFKHLDFFYSHMCSMQDVLEGFPRLIQLSATTTCCSSMWTTMILPRVTLNRSRVATGLWVQG